MSKENPYTLFHTKEKIWMGLPMVYLSRRVRDAMNGADILPEKKINKQYSMPKTKTSV